MSTISRSRRHRGLIALAVASIAALTFAGCAQETEGPADNGADTMVPEADLGVLKDKVPAEWADGMLAATQADLAPLTFTNDDGDVVGLHPDLFQALSEVLGVEIKVEAVTFENLILGLDSGTYDLASNTTIKNERLDKYDMLSYMNSSYSVATLKSADKLGDEVTAICGVDMAVVTGEIIVDHIADVVQGECAAAGLPPVNTTEYKDFASAVLAVQSENAEAMLLDTMSFGYFQLSDAGVDFDFNGPTGLIKSDTGISFLKDQDQELAVVIEEALNVLIDNGVYAEIFEKWGLTESSLKDERPVLNPTATI